MHISSGNKPFLTLSNHPFRQVKTPIFESFRTKNNEFEVPQNRTKLMKIEQKRQKNGILFIRCWSVRIIEQPDLSDLLIIPIADSVNSVHSRSFLVGTNGFMMVFRHRYCVADLCSQRVTETKNAILNHVEKDDVPKWNPIDAMAEESICSKFDDF